MQLSESDNQSVFLNTQNILLKSDQNEGVHQDVRSDKTARSETRSMLAPGLRDYVAFCIGSVPEVEAVFTLHRGKVFYVWAVVAQSEPEIRKRIYAKEKEIIGLYDDFDFDFNIVPSRGQAVSSVISDPAVTLAFKRS